VIKCTSIYFLDTMKCVYTIHFTSEQKVIYILNF